MEKPIRSLHHVTATVSDAQDDLDFYTGLLGQRLVKKTVNFDNTRVYHFYYGDERGTPGTIMTTFPYGHLGVRQGTHGTGQITTTSFSIPEGSVPYWSERLAFAGVPFTVESSGFGEETLVFKDPSGLTIRLVEGTNDDRQAWSKADIDDNRAVRGIHSVTLTVPNPRQTLGFMNEMMDTAVVGEREGGLRVAVNGDKPGRLVDILSPDDAYGVNGIGTVHHVAFAVDDPDQQLELRRELLRRGIQVTDVMDRQYFKSIYFREPGGVLFEVATVPPGFTADESVADLGTSLKLPPWEEVKRPIIEAGLPDVRPS
jgi:glyoxalase family protein